MLCLVGRGCLLLMAGGLLWGCQSSDDPLLPASRPTQHPPITAISQAPSTVPIRTLPPTWTPAPSGTPTPSPRPSDTPTLTITPSQTPTRTAKAICDQFVVVRTPEPSVSVAYGGAIGFGWENAPPDSLIVLSLVPLGVGDPDADETLAQFAPDLGFNAFFPVDNLPRWGSYEWRLSLYIEPYGEICTGQAGEIFREPWWYRPILNPFAPSFAP